MDAFKRIVDCTNRKHKKMEDMFLIAQGTHYLRDVHLISDKALDVFFSKLTHSPTSVMEARLSKESLSKVPILKLKHSDSVDSGNLECEWVVGSETGAYAEHFKKMQKGNDCIKVVVTGNCGSDKMIGYSVYYIYTAGNSDTLIAFIHDHPTAEAGKVAMIASSDEKHHAAALAYITSNCYMTPFSKICCGCGQSGGNLMKCACRKVRYCSKDCQTTHWEEHRARCPCTPKKARE